MRKRALLKTRVPLRRTFFFKTYVPRFPKEAEGRTSIRASFRKGVLLLPSASFGFLNLIRFLRLPSASFGKLHLWRGGGFLKEASPLAGWRLPSPSFGILRHPTASFGILRHPSASFGILRHPSASFGILRHPSASFGILRHPSETSTLFLREKGLPSEAKVETHYPNKVRSTRTLNAAVLPSTECVAARSSLKDIRPTEDKADLWKPSICSPTSHVTTGRYPADN